VRAVVPRKAVAVPELGGSLALQVFDIRLLSPSLHTSKGTGENENENENEKEQEQEQEQEQDPTPP
jgi:hypothetical protein